MESSRSLLRVFLRHVRRGGYRCVFRRQEWTEVLLSNGAERWFGAGFDRAGALDDALRQMFPSIAAREALRVLGTLQELGRDPHDAASVGLHGAEAPAARSVEVLTNEAPTLVQETPPTPHADEPHEREPHERIAPGPASTPPRGTPLEPAPEATSSSNSTTTGLEPIRTNAAVQLTFAALSEQGATSPRPNRWETGRVLEALPTLRFELEDLEETVAELFDEHLLYAPRRQRLHLLAWVARARDLEDRAAGRGDFDWRVTALVAKLGQLSKLGWPGSVYALNLAAQPADCTVDLEPAARPRTWAELAEDAEGELEAEERRVREGTLRCDEFGWSDRTALRVGVPNALELMQDVRTRLERWFGPLITVDQVLRSGARVEELSWKRIADFDGELRKELPMLARRLRWLRADPPPAWGEAIGRVRCIAHFMDPAFRRVLETLLDDRHSPARTWAAECGYDVALPLRRERVQDLLCALADAAGRATDGVVTALSRLLELGEEFEVRSIAVQLRPHASALLEVPEARMSGRKQRRRLKRLHDALRAPVETSGVEVGPVATQIDVARSDVPAVPEAILVHTRGRRVLFVGNRNDPELDAELCRTFEFGEFRHVAITANRTEAAAQSVRQGSFDLVLAATGFLPHKTDAVLRTACRQGDVRYVRVDKGRVSACRRHLAREFRVSAT